MLSQLVSMLGSRSQSVQIVGLLTILSLAPSILIMLTSFVRVIMVLSFTRNALGLQQMPPNQVLVGLALFLTLFIMGPVVDEIKTEAYIPYIAEQITLEEAV
ncbi:MAG: flagellar biosynthetic protein FliP, partial [Clostridia bacterium]|nr:flagellar biosynthetic protein FliP [Clostridia bacterium]